MIFMWSESNRVVLTSYGYTKITVRRNLEPNFYDRFRHNLSPVTMAVLAGLLFSAAILLFGVILGTAVLRNGSKDMVS